MSMDILIWLLFGASLGIAMRFARPWKARRLSAGRQTTPADNPPGSRWRSVGIVPGAGACTGARRLRERRWLSGEAPRLPLAGCDSTRCQCRYRRHADRRDEEDRRNPINAMGKYGGFEAVLSEDRRSPSDRRSEATSERG
jgi:hypothetical protein